MWSRWSIKAPQLQNTTDTDCHETQVSLQDTSPSLHSQSMLSTAPCEDKYTQDSDIYVPESEVEMGRITPQTDMAVEDLLNTSLRQKNVRTVDRILGNKPDQLISVRASPIRGGISGDMELRLLTSPDLLTSTPNDIYGRTVGTQLLFEDTPVALEDRDEELGYSGHETVFLPASFEENVNRVLSSDPLDATEIRDASSAKNEAPNIKKVQSTASPNKRMFRSTPPTVTTTQDLKKQKRVSFKASTPSTGQMLSSLDRQEKRHLEKSCLKIVSTPLIKYSVLTTLTGGPVNSSIGPGQHDKSLETEDAPKESTKPGQRTSSSSSKAKLGTTKSNKSTRPQIPESTPKVANARPNSSRPPRTDFRTLQKQTESKALHEYVWARAKPDHPHQYVPATLIGPTGSSTRRLYKVRLHRMSSPINLYPEDFFPIDFANQYSVRLTKKPGHLYTVIGWNDRTALVKSSYGQDYQVPTRHLILHTADALTPSPMATSGPKKSLFENLRFIVTCGTDSLKKVTILSLITQYGGVLQDTFESKNVLLIATEPKRTYKYLMALISNVPRLAPQWIVESIEKGRLVDHSKYCLDDCLIFEQGQLNGQKWSVQGSAVFKKEFGCILELLGAEIRDGSQRVLCQGVRQTRGAGAVSAETLVDCIMRGALSSL